MPRAFILCGGYATRLGSFARERPKILQQVGGRVFYDDLMDWITREGIDEVHLLLGHLSHAVIDHAEEVRHISPIYHVSEPAGTAAAVRKALASTEHAETLVLNGDTIAALSLRHFVQWARRCGAPSVLAATTQGRPNVCEDQYGYLTPPPGGDSEADLCDLGVLWFGERAVEAFCDASFPPGADMKTAVSSMGPRAVRILRSDAPFTDIGTPDGLQAYRNERE